MSAYLYTLITLFLLTFSYADVQITGLQDYDFETISLPFTTLQMDKTVCIYRTGNRLGIRVTAVGEHDTNTQFRLENGPDFIPYEVFITNPNRNTFRQLRPDTPRNRRAQNRSRFCTASNTLSRLRIRIPASSFNNNLRAGTYNDTLAITISPR